MDAWRHQFPDATEIPPCGELSRARVAIFDLDYDAILAAMYVVSTTDEGDCYLCVPPYPGIEAAALGAGEAGCCSMVLVRVLPQVLVSLLSQPPLAPCQVSTSPRSLRTWGTSVYFLLVVDDYSHYTTVFAFRTKGDVTEVDAVEPVEVAVDSGAARAPEPAGAGPGGAEPWGAEPGGAESRGAEPGGAESVCSCGLSRCFVEAGAPLSVGAARVVCPAAGAVLLELEVLLLLLVPGGARIGGTGAAGTRGAAGAAGVSPAGGTAGAAGGTGAAGPAGVGAAGAAGATGAGAAGGIGTGGSAGAGASEGAGVGAVGAGGAAGAGAAAGGTGAVPAGSGGAAQPRPYFVPLLEQVLGLPPSTGRAPSLRVSHSVSRSRLTLFVLPLLLSRVSWLLVVTNPSFESTAASALVAELVDFAARCRLDYTTSLVAESESVCPPSVGGECALSTDVLEDRQGGVSVFCCCFASSRVHADCPEGDPDAPDIPTPRSYAEAIEGPYSSQWQSTMDAEMASWKSTGTYVDEVPPPGANIVSGMWIFRVKRPPGSPPVFKARYVALGFTQRQGVGYFHTFSPTPKMTTLWVLLHIAAQRDYELHSLDFSTAFCRAACTRRSGCAAHLASLGRFLLVPSGASGGPVYGLRQAPP
ncbi:unnamed protein product [Closterium sp. NIES-64]|nr:unnamed protein product [Closterium sp. NIES-64]